MQLLAKDRDARFPTARAARAALAACEDSPRNGPGELVAYLAKRFPPSSQHAVRAPKGTKAAPGAGAEDVEVTNTADLADGLADDLGDEPAACTTATAPAPGAPPAEATAPDVVPSSASDLDASDCALPAHPIGDAAPTAPAAAWLLRPHRSGRGALGVVVVSALLAVVAIVLLLR